MGGELSFAAKLNPPDITQGDLRHADLQYRNPYSVARTVLLMSRWFRHYGGLARDEKLVSVAVKSRQSVERVVWVWSAILESASEINDNGRYEFDTAEAAYFLRCDDAELGSILTCMESLGRLCDGVVARWGDRQYSSDSAAERQRRYRERKSGKAGIYEDDRNDKRDSDVTVTSPSVTVTAQDTDTDTDTDKKDTSLRSVAPAAPKPTVKSELLNVLDAEHAQDIIDHRNKIKKPMTPKAAKMLAKKLSAFTKPNEAADFMIERGWQSIEPVWVDNYNSRGSPSPQQNGKPRNIAEASTQLLAELRAANADTEPGTSNSRLEQAFPSLAPPVRQFGPE